jgi:hypothetical protein
MTWVMRISASFQGLFVDVDSSGPAPISAARICDLSSWNEQ